MLSTEAPATAFGNNTSPYLYDWLLRAVFSNASCVRVFQSPHSPAPQVNAAARAADAKRPKPPRPGAQPPAAPEAGGAEQYPGYAGLTSPFGAQTSLASLQKKAKPQGTPVPISVISNLYSYPTAKVNKQGMVGMKHAPTLATRQSGPSPQSRPLSHISPQRASPERMSAEARKGRNASPTESVRTSATETVARARERSLEKQELRLASDLMQLRKDMARASAKLGTGNVTTDEALRMHDYAARMLSEAIAATDGLERSSRPGRGERSFGRSVDASELVTGGSNALGAQGARKEQRRGRSPTCKAWRPGGASSRPNSAGRNGPDRSKTEQAQKQLAARAARIRWAPLPGGLWACSEGLHLFGDRIACCGGTKRVCCLFQEEYSALLQLTTWQRLQAGLRSYVLITPIVRLPLTTLCTLRIACASYGLLSLRPPAACAPCSQVPQRGAPPRPGHRRRRQAGLLLRAGL